jgi:hypothetical protein
MARLDGFWAALPGRLLHPTQMQILEALFWIGRPLSATDLTRIFFEQPGRPLVEYHVGRLADLGILRKAGSRTVRGGTETFFEPMDGDSLRRPPPPRS